MANVCEICGNPLTNPRAITCSPKCKSQRWRKMQAAKHQPLNNDEMRSLVWFNQHVPKAGESLSQLLADHGKGALLLAFVAINEYANFLEETTKQNPEVQRVG